MAAAASPDQVHRAISTAVDAGFYRTVHLDLEGADPMAHYLASGWREGRDPNSRFPVRDDLETYPEVAGAGSGMSVNLMARAAWP